jgi:hypothetical protein
MAWILATIGKSDTRNWEICKEHNLWGISVLGKNNFIHKASRGDSLLFWVGGKGFVGTAVATEDSRVPSGPEEIPWRGGNSRYGFINYLTTSNGKKETLPGLFSLPLQLFA